MENQLLDLCDKDWSGLDGNGQYSVNNTLSGVEISVPLEFTVGTLTFLGYIADVPILFVIIRKRKNPIGS